MIGLRETVNGPRLPITYNGFTWNDPDDDPEDTAEINDTQPGQTFDAVQDVRQMIDGLEVYGARKVATTQRLRGVLRAPTLARLFDRWEEMAVALDPALASLNNPTVFGFLPLDFSVPTEDLTNFPSGLMACRYYMRTLRSITPLHSDFTGTSAAFDFEMLAKDPRRYLQATSSLAGAGTAANTLADYISWPTVTITMSGAGSATYQLANSTVGRTLYLDLSGRIASDVVVVEMETKRVTINGTVNNGIATNASSSYWWVAPGNNTITITNGTNASTVLTWRPAFVL